MQWVDRIIWMLIFIMSVGLIDVHAQDDQEKILAIRSASNLVLRSYDYQQELSFQTEDVLITTGNGTLLTGKESLKKLLESGSNKMYWIRTPAEVKINSKKGLAWETGTWKGYDPAQGNHSVTGGNYSAMWTSESGVWRIKSQLFVTLE